MNSTSTSASTSGSSSPITSVRASRASLACLPCRSRHLKCDAKRPYCARCTSVGKACLYARSRRGGLDRETLAARREKATAAAVSHGSEHQPMPEEEAEAPHHGPANGMDRPLDGPDTIYLSGSSLAGAQPDNLFGGFDNHWLSRSTLSPVSLPPPPSGPLSIRGDKLIDSYYHNFHALHPCALPKTHLERVLQNPAWQPGLVPVLAVMRLIGAVYTRSKELAELKNSVDTCLLQTPSVNPFLVQCRLLYSIPLYWQGDKAGAQAQMDVAIALARELSMFRREFAAQHGDGDVLLEECWRRTWWQLYILDCCYAGTTRTTPFETKGMAATVDLPCEEDEYESGAIPPPKTLQDFDSREFAIEPVAFSSFGQLIGAARCAALSYKYILGGASFADSPQIIDSIDSILDGWLMLLPETKQQVMSKTGKIDELMFQAILMLHTCVIGLHRPFSDLHTDAVEMLSSCSSANAPDPLATELVNIHTVRCLGAAKAQARLFALPVRPFHHTPFVTCMTSSTALGLLSACKLILTGDELAVARDQIRLQIGCLKALADFWPQTARNLLEIQMIAQDVLGLVPKPTYGSSGAVTSTNQDGAQQPRQDTMVQLPDPGPAATPWGDPGELEPDLCMWFDLNGIQR